MSAADHHRGALRVRRCASHANREAAAKCRACQKDFCRECVTENGGIMMCAGCLAESKAGRRRRCGVGHAIMLAGMFAVGFFVIWSVFMTLGRILASIPQQYHERQ